MDERRGKIPDYRPVDDKATDPRADPANRPVSPPNPRTY